MGAIALSDAFPRSSTSTHADYAEASTIENSRDRDDRPGLLRHILDALGRAEHPQGMGIRRDSSSQSHADVDYHLGLLPSENSPSSQCRRDTRISSEISTSRRANAQSIEDYVCYATIHLYLGMCFQPLSECRRHAGLKSWQ